MLPTPHVPGTHGQQVLAARPQPQEGQRLTPDASHNGGKPPPRDGLPPPPRYAAPSRECRPKGQCWAPTPAHPHPQRVGSGPRQPALRTGSRGRTSTWPQKLLTTAQGGPLGTPSRHPHSASRRLARTHAVEHTATGPGRPPRAGRGTAPNTGRPSQWWKAAPSRDSHPPAPRHAALGRACKPKGQCWAPTSARLRPEHAGGGAQQPNPMATSRGRTSA